MWSDFLPTADFGCCCVSNTKIKLNQQFTPKIYNGLRIEYYQNHKNAIFLGWPPFWGVRDPRGSVAHLFYYNLLNDIVKIK